MAILILDKVELRATTITRDKEGHLIMIIMYLMRGSKYKQRKLLKVKGETDKFTIRIRDFNTSFNN